MNRKGTIDNFFKNKRNKLSLNQKNKMVEKNVIAYIELSDEEDTRNSDKSTINRSDCSDSSHTTEPYSLNSFSATPSKQTPIKVSPTIYRSPTSKPKYFSPIKKRSLSLKDSPSKAKRNISQALMEAGNSDIYQENEFLNYTQGLDDHTKFLLTIIYQFLKDDSLKLLLNEKSTALLAKSLDVKKPGMRIVCRLFWRNGIWYRLDNIQKIADKSVINNGTINEVLKSLVENGYLNASDYESDWSFDDLVNLLKLDELLEICKSFKLKFKKKEEAIQALKNFSNQKINMTHFLTGVGSSNNKNRVLKALSLKVGGCYKLSDFARSTLKELYILMYLGMDYSIIREKQLQLTLLNEKSKRESYPVPKDIQLDSASVVFNDRQEFERYLKAHEIYEEFLATSETNLKCDIVKHVYNLYNGIDKELMLSYISKPKWLLRFTPPHLFIKILAEGIQYLKREKIQDNLDLAVNILTTIIEQNTFRQHKKCEWYSEKALIIDKLLMWPDEAASVLLEAFEAELPEEYKEILKVRAQLLVNRKTNPVKSSLKDKLLPYLENNDIKEKNIKATHIYKVPMCSTGRGKVKFETRTAMGVQVRDAEDYCVYHYIEDGKYTHGQHWEGRIVTTIFFLLFWDIIYTPIKGLRGIFLSHYQMYPLDMFTESFYTNRKTLIEERLREIEGSSIEELLERIDSTWKSRPENELSGIDRSTSLPQVCSVVQSLGARRSAALCRRLAVDYSRTHSGFPDLTMWNENTGHVTFVEVKTDTDKPSIKQIQWMHYMKQHDIDTEFCYVGVNTTRCRTRNCDD